FDGDMRPRTLQPPIGREEPRYGEGGVECRACEQADHEFLWTNERWRLRAVGPTGLPVVLILEPREHYAEPGDLPDALAAECGVLALRPRSASASSSFAVSIGCSSDSTTSFAFSIGSAMDSSYPAAPLPTLAPCASTSRASAAPGRARFRASWPTGWACPTWRS